MRIYEQAGVKRETAGIGTGWFPSIYSASACRAGPAEAASVINFEGRPPFRLTSSGQGSCAPPGSGPFSISLLSSCQLSLLMPHLSLRSAHAIFVYQSYRAQPAFAALSLASFPTLLGLG